MNLRLKCNARRYSEDRSAMSKLDVIHGDNTAFYSTFVLLLWKGRVALEDILKISFEK